MNEEFYENMNNRDLILKIISKQVDKRTIYFKREMVDEGLVFST
jgi:hypothetical protein